MRPFCLRQRAERPCIISGRTRSRDFHLAADSRKEREYVKCNQTKDKNGCFVSDGSCSNVHIYGICAAGYGICLQFLSSGRADLQKTFIGIENYTKLFA